MPAPQLTCPPGAAQMHARHVRRAHACVARVRTRSPLPGPVCLVLSRRGQVAAALHTLAAMREAVHAACHTERLPPSTWAVAVGTTLASVREVLLVQVPVSDGDAEAVATAPSRSDIDVQTRHCLRQLIVAVSSSRSLRDVGTPSPTPSRPHALTLSLHFRRAHAHEPRRRTRPPPRQLTRPRPIGSHAFGPRPPCTPQSRPECGCWRCARRTAGPRPAHKCAGRSTRGVCPQSCNSTLSGPAARASPRRRRFAVSGSSSGQRLWRSARRERDPPGRHIEPRRAAAHCPSAHLPICPICPICWMRPTQEARPTPLCLTTRTSTNECTVPRQ